MPRIGAGKRKGGDVMSRLIDLTGQQFERLTVISRAENTTTGKAQWYCECECDKKIVVVRGEHLRSGHTTSCGCIQKENAAKAQTVHSKSRSRIYRIWASLKKRIQNENNKNYKDYGGRGITICEEWESNFQAFNEWAISNGYTDNLTIDRIDNDKGYSPDNCRWITRKKQCNNKRNNSYITFRGSTKTLSEWAEEYGIQSSTILMRLRRGWSIEKALTTPPRKSK
jgi:hypothetical protein